MLTKTLGSLTGCNIINITNLSGEQLLEKHLVGAVECRENNIAPWKNRQIASKVGKHKNLFSF